MGKLSVKQIGQLNEPGLYADGEGLYLHVRKGGSKQWLLRTTVHKKRTDIGLGSASIFSLAEAREKSRDYLKIVKSGGDPLGERKRQEGIPSFEEAARTLWEQKKDGWKNEVHVRQWITTITDYAFPLIGALKVDHITSAHILSVLTPIWLEKPETAKRVKQRMKTVFDWAKVAGYRKDDNPVVGIEQALPKRPTSEKHHEALPWKEMPEFMAELVKREATSALALRFLILTATRSNETRGLLLDWPA